MTEEIDVSNSRYAILNSSKLDSVEWDEVFDTAENVRWNLENSKFILEFSGEPSFLSEVEKFSLEEIESLMATNGFI